MAKGSVQAIAYLRTSSASNVGTDKDSDKRQRVAIAAFAKAAGFEVVAEYYDAAVSGADPIETRPGFSDLLDKIEGNGCRTVIVEDVSRFARDMVAHILGLALLRERGVTLLASNGQNLTDDTDEMTEALVTMTQVFATLEKKRLVKKLTAARKRKRQATGQKVEGRKSHAEARPDVVALAKKLRRKRPKGGQRSLREISAALEAAGYLNERGKPYAANSVRGMVG